MRQLVRAVEIVISQSRYLMVPFLLGLIVGLAALLYTFFAKLLAFLKSVPSSTDGAIVEILKLVNLSLIANLLLVIIFAGYERFVAPLSVGDRAGPPGLTGIGFSGTRQRILGTIVAISAVNVLEWFMDVDRGVDNDKLVWVVVILLAFSIAILLAAIADRLTLPIPKQGPSVKNNNNDDF